MIILKKENLSSQSISIQFWFTMAMEIQFLDAQNDKDVIQNYKRKMRLWTHHVYLNNWTTDLVANLITFAENDWQKG